MACACTRWKASCETAQGVTWVQMYNCAAVPPSRVAGARFSCQPLCVACPGLAGPRGRQGRPVPMADGMGARGGAADKGARAHGGWEGQCGRWGGPPGRRQARKNRPARSLSRGGAPRSAAAAAPGGGGAAAQLVGTGASAPAGSASRVLAPRQLQQRRQTLVPPAAAAAAAASV